MPQLIASPFLDQYLVVRFGAGKGVQIDSSRFGQLVTDHAAAQPVPRWLVDASSRTWDLDLTGQRLTDAVLLRCHSPLGYARASWEINKGCDYDCEHCHLGAKQFEGLAWNGKVRLLDTMRDAGVLWLQITGGEPLIDREFPAAYAYATQLGMMVAISSNGSQLSKPRILECLTTYRPYRLTLSVYGATADSYEG